jgi:hypothetical protein
MNSKQKLVRDRAIKEFLSSCFEVIAGVCMVIVIVFVILVSLGLFHVR